MLLIKEMWKVFHFSLRVHSLCTYNWLFSSSNAQHLRAVKARGEAAAQAAPLEIPEQYAKLIAKTADEDLLRDIQDFLGLVQVYILNALSSPFCSSLPTLGVEFVSPKKKMRGFILLYGGETVQHSLQFALVDETPSNFTWTVSLFFCLRFGKMKFTCRTQQTHQKF